MIEGASCPLHLNRTSRVRKGEAACAELCSAGDGPFYSWHPETGCCLDQTMMRIWRWGLACPQTLLDAARSGECLKQNIHGGIRCRGRRHRGGGTRSLGPSGRRATDLHALPLARIAVPQRTQPSRAEGPGPNVSIFLGHVAPHLLTEYKGPTASITCWTVDTEARSRDTGDRSGPDALEQPFCS